MPFDLKQASMVNGSLIAFSAWAMANPWLQIPLLDYEQHMDLPAVGQAQMLSNELAMAVSTFEPRSVAVIGCAGGNGFDRLMHPSLQRVVGIDINAAYIKVAQARYARTLRGLELHVADIEVAIPGVAAVELIFVGLVLEYVDVSSAMKTLHSLCKENGIVVIVLQQPSFQQSAISASPYISLRSLNGSMHLRDPKAVLQISESFGFQGQTTRTVALPSGKEFAVLTLRRSRRS